MAQDTEGFPRRAVLKAFNGWLSGPRPPPCLDQSLSAVLTLGIDDFDWEVKVHTLELAETLMDKWLDESRCPLAEALEKLQEEYGVFGVLFKGLLDCDRPVAQRACQLLLKLREVMEVKGESAGSSTSPSSVGSKPTFQLQSHQWGEDLLRKCKGVSDSDWSGEGKPAAHWPPQGEEVSLREVIGRLDLEGMRDALARSSDHSMASPRSLMEDILAVAQQSDDNAVDCY